MELRRYKPSDCKEISKLFYETIHSVNINDYSNEQLNAWATGDINLNEWNKSFLSHYTVVAIDKAVIIGFGDIERSGYLDRLYIHKDYQKRGVATKICNVLESFVNADRIITHSSITAKAFFEKRGYKLIKEQQVERNNIFITNYVMVKLINQNLIK